MYPVLFRIGTFDITSFGVMVAIGALVGVWVFGRELARSGLPASAVDAAIAGIVGGLLGAKMLWVAEHLGETPFTDLLFSRGGMSWFGGLAGGIGTGLLVMWWRRIPVVAALAAATPASRSATRLGASAASWLETITAGQPIWHGALRFPAVSRRRMSPSTRRSCTKRSRWPSWPGVS